MTDRRPLQITVRIAAPPDPTMLRAAIASRLAGRPFPTRVEDAVGARVAGAIREHVRNATPWR